MKRRKRGAQREGSILALLGALSLGALTGAAFGLLFAPAPGSETRSRLTYEASRLRRKTERLVDELGERLGSLLEQLHKQEADLVEE